MKAPPQPPGCRSWPLCPTGEGGGGFLPRPPGGGFCMRQTAALQVSAPGGNTGLAASPPNSRFLIPPVGSFDVPASSAVANFDWRHYAGAPRSGGPVPVEEEEEEGHRQNVLGQNIPGPSGRCLPGGDIIPPLCARGTAVGAATAWRAPRLCLLVCERGVTAGPASRGWPRVQ